MKEFALTKKVKIENEEVTLRRLINKIKNKEKETDESITIAMDSMLDEVKSKYGKIKEFDFKLFFFDETYVFIVLQGRSE